MNVISDLFGTITHNLTGLYKRDSLLDFAVKALRFNRNYWQLSLWRPVKFILLTRLKKKRFKYRNLCLCICCWLSTDPLVESTSRRLIPRRLTFVLQNIHVILVKQCKEVQENNTWSGSFIDWEGRGSEGEKRGGGVSWLWLISKCGWYSRLNLFSSFAIKMFDCFANNFFQNISINSRAKWSKVLLVLSSLLALFATPSHLIWCVWVCHIVLICSKLPILLSWLCSF